MRVIGNESTAVVEFAPYQKIPTEKKKVDSRLNTIEKGMSKQTGVGFQLTELLSYRRGLPVVPGVAERAIRQAI